MLPNITKLDNIDVTEEERREASETYKNLSQTMVQDEDVCCSLHEKADAAAAAELDRQEADRFEAANNAVHTQSQNNILFAVLALLKELDRDALRTVESEVLHRLRSTDSSRKH